MSFIKNSIFGTFRDPWEIVEKKVEEVTMENSNCWSTVCWRGNNKLGGTLMTRTNHWGTVLLEGLRLKMLLGWQGGWRQFRLHFSYSTSSAWASNDSEFLDKESTFTIYNLQSDALHICDTSYKQWHGCPANVKLLDSQTKHRPPDWIRWQSRGQALHLEASRTFNSRMYPIFLVATFEGLPPQTIQN